MKHFVLTLLSAPLLLAGCAASPVAPTWNPSPAVTASHSAGPSLTLGPAPAQESRAKVVLSDPEAVLHEAGSAFGPAGFAVAGDHIWLSNPNPYDLGSGHVYSYIDSYVAGQRKSRTKVPDHQANDLLVRQGRLYAVQTDWDPGHKSQVVSYQIDGFKLTSEQLLKDNITPGEDLLLRFDGDSLVASALDGGSTVIDGPGPAPAKPQYFKGDHTVTIPAAGGLPAITVKVQGHGTVEQLARDEHWVYYLVWDEVLSGGGSQVYRYVYRVSADAQRPTLSYTLHGTVDADLPNRAVLVANGLVYQLLVADNTTKVLLVQPNP